MYFRSEKRTLTIAIQEARLRHVFPDSQINLNKNADIVWVGKLQPSPLSATYTVKIKYHIKERPEVTILEPMLQSRNGARLPHVFSGNRLCLFRFKYYEWNSTMPIVDTIVPWTSLWLLHYEVWLATGKWCGSVAEHPGDEGKLKTG